MEDFRGKRILIMGLARSGLAAARLLTKLGADVTVTEAKDPDRITEKDELEALGVRLAAQTKEIFEEPFDLAVKNPGINGNLWFVQRLRERGVPVITEIELAYRAAAKQKYIAVTGTNGKTTTASLLYEIFRLARPGKTHLSGNIGDWSAC